MNNENPSRTFTNRELAKKFIRAINAVRVNKRRLSNTAKGELLIELAKEFFAVDEPPAASNVKGDE